MDLSFSGAGFMGCYYFGVVDCWNKYIPRDRVNRVAGASAGSLIAAYYLMDLPLSSCLKKIIELTEDVRRRPLGVFDRSNQIVDVLPRVLAELFPDDAHKRVSGRLFVCMTRLKDMKKIIVSEFESKQDLIDALNCSCFIPVWSGNHVSTYKGVKHIDGGFSDNLPVFDEHTIRICCFSGASDVSPYDRTKMELLSGTVLNTPLFFNFANLRRFRKALFPPPASFIVDLLERGFHDAKGFILSNDLIQCNGCYDKTALRDQPIYSKFSPTMTPSISPASSYLNLADNGAMLGQQTKPAAKSGRCQRKRPGKALEGAISEVNFSELLHEKLRNCSPDSANELHISDSIISQSSASEISESDKQPNHIGAPSIVIQTYEEVNGNVIGATATDGEKPNPLAGLDGLGNRSSGLTSASSSSSCSSSDEGLESPCKRARANVMSPTERFLANRRNTIQDNAKQLLVVQDRFTSVQAPLPSCPPSPNLNRHCIDCIRMRQEARMDLIEEEIRREAEKYREPNTSKHGSLKSKLTSPIKWIRQLGIKSSYKFPDGPTTLRTAKSVAAM